VTLAAVLAPALAPHDPSAIIDRPMAPAGGETMLGTDDLGRDLVSRLLYASRVSLAVGVGAACSRS
jgi:peptide/nickel transport system permease protein